VGGIPTGEPGRQLRCELALRARNPLAANRKIDKSQRCDEYQ